MKLKLKNFRCYDDAVFDFGSKGLTLLSGSSGKGKSTLLMAVDFALFGTGTKIISNGKRSCCVELEFGDLKIVRKKGPNHLIVNDTYEDDAGEAIIQKKFGKIFNSVSYIPQNLKKSFVLMSPSERLDFLETFAFSNFDIAQLKDRMRSVIKEANEILLKTIGNLDYATKMLEERPKPTAVSFPAKVSRENREKYISDMETKRKNSEIHIKRGERELQVLRGNKGKRDILLAKKDEKSKLLSTLEEEKEKRKKELSEIPENTKTLEELERKLALHLDSKKTLDLIRSVEEAKTRLKELKANEVNEMRESLRLLTEKLWQDGSFEELVEQVEVWEIVCEKKKTLSDLESSMKKLKITEDGLEDKIEKCKDAILETQKNIEISKLEKECFSCPSCRAKVRFLNNTLIAVDIKASPTNNIDELDKRLKTLLQRRNELQLMMEEERKRDTLCSQIKRIKLELNELLEEDITSKECEENLKSSKELLKDNTEIESKIKSLQSNLANNVFSTTITRLEQRVIADEKKIETKDIVNAGDNEEELREKIWKVKSDAKQREHVQKMLTSVESSVERYREELAEINKELKAVDHQDYENKLTEITENVRLHTKRKSDIDHFFEKLSMWKQNDKEVTEYKKLVKSVEDLKEKETYDRKKYASACLFREKILESESIYISNLIASINTHVQIYLDHFFPDNPISARISSFKENGKNESKPCINLEIDYKGIEHDLTMLSGGELSRVILSFTLAFADLYNSPLILLDECTASLDQDLTASVIGGLKDNFGDKLVVLIAHQVVQGSFDKVIQL